ncbi:hypothetical protein V1264_023404 [Littorina saxatilis]|uniref:Uncharacterized protein n=1 Tax=Littorina saxatilis TaxID=31220 RepID=A0AAN9GB45_9CAEN
MILGPGTSQTGIPDLALPIFFCLAGALVGVCLSALLLFCVEIQGIPSFVLGKSSLQLVCHQESVENKPLQVKKKACAGFFLCVGCGCKLNGGWHEQHRLVWNLVNFAKFSFPF